MPLISKDKDPGPDTRDRDRGETDSDLSEDWRPLPPRLPQTETRSYHDDDGNQCREFRTWKGSEIVEASIETIGSDGRKKIVCERFQSGNVVSRNINHYPNQKAIYPERSSSHYNQPEDGEQVWAIKREFDPETHIRTKLVYEYSPGRLDQKYRQTNWDFINEDGAHVQKTLEQFGLRQDKKRETETGFRADFWTPKVITERYWPGRPDGLIETRTSFLHEDRRNDDPEMMVEEKYDNHPDGKVHSFRSYYRQPDGGFIIDVMEQVPNPGEGGPTYTDQYRIVNGQRVERRLG